MCRPFANVLLASGSLLTITLAALFRRSSRPSPSSSTCMPLSVGVLRSCVLAVPPPCMPSVPEFWRDAAGCRDLSTNHLSGTVLSQFSALTKLSNLYAPPCWQCAVITQTGCVAALYAVHALRHQRLEDVLLVTGTFMKIVSGALFRHSSQLSPS